MNKLVLEFQINELNRNIATCRRIGKLDQAEKLTKDLEVANQDLAITERRELEERVGLRSLERNA